MLRIIYNCYRVQFWHNLQQSNLSTIIIITIIIYSSAAAAVGTVPFTSCIRDVFASCLFLHSQPHQLINLCTRLTLFWLQLLNTRRIERKNISHPPCRHWWLITQTWGRSNDITEVSYLFYTTEFVHSALVAVHTVLSQVEMGRILRAKRTDTVKRRS